MLRLDDVTLVVGGRVLLSDASWHVHPGEKVALIGRNGTGKSTLFRTIAGELEAESGTITVRRGAAVGTLPQQGVPAGEESVWVVASSWMHRLLGLKAALEAAEEAVAAQAADGPERLAEATEAFRLAGGFAMEERIGELLHGLGFEQELWHRPVAELSGGWRMRVALARLLLSEPDLLLLDEPTNHLDLAGRNYLGGFLRDYQGTVVLVSHDRHLLGTVPTRIAEIRYQRLDTWTGTLESWLAERTLRELQQAAAHERQHAEIERLERFVERFRAKASKASQARSKQKAIDRIERIDAPERHGREARLKLPDPPASGNEAVWLDGVDLAWGPQEPLVVSGVDLRVNRGMRLVLLGANGAGKSTVLQCIAGRLAPRTGRRVLGRGVRVGVFSQDLAAELPAELTPVQEVLRSVPLAPVARVRAVLGALGLEGNTHERPIGTLSGGEKARVALASFVLRPVSLMLLDEPTNHLDVETVEVLVEALAQWTGALVVVTHDRWLVEQVATHVAHVVDGRLSLHQGVEESDFELKGREDSGPTEATQGAIDWEERKAAKRAGEKARRRIQALQTEIPEAEGRLEALDQRLAGAYAEGSGGSEIEGLFQERHKLEAEIAGLYGEWEELEELAEESLA